MKKLNQLFILLLLVSIPVLSVSAKKVSMVVNYSFLNITDGYDHLNKVEVFVDDELVATSSEKKQSKKNSVKLQFDGGNHTVKIVNYAFYEGNWEEHTVANNYSYDCLYEFTQDFKKAKYKVNLIFDLNSGTKAKVK